MLDNETYLTPEKAVEMGFADEVGKAETPAPDITQQLQQQIAQMRREMTAQKAFREEMKRFCGQAQRKKDADDEDDDKDTDDDSTDTDDTDDEGDGDNDNTDDDSDKDDTDDEDDKKQKARQHKLAALIGQAAAQYLKER